MKRLLFGLLIRSSALPLTAVTWPIKASANRRYLTESSPSPVPFLLNRDEGHSIIGLAPISGYSTYLSSRQGYKFNCTQILGSTPHGASSGAAQDGTLPFTSGNGPSSYVFGPDGTNVNNAYWTKVDSFVSMAAADGLVVMLNPLSAQFYDCNTNCAGGAGAAFANNGATTVQPLGAYFGNRYKNSPNIIGHIGDDCQIPGSTNSINCNLPLENDFIPGILSTPEANHDGNSEWVLVLDATGVGSPVATVLPPTSLQVAHVQTPRVIARLIPDLIADSIMYVLRTQSSSFTVGISAFLRTLPEDVNRVDPLGGQREKTLVSLLLISVCASKYKSASSGTLGQSGLKLHGTISTMLSCITYGACTFLS